MSENELDILIDGLGKGGAESLLVSMLPVLKKKFKVITIYFLKNKGPYTKEFERYATLKPVSVWQLIYFLLKSKDRFIYAHLFYPIFFVNLFAVLARKQKNTIFCHEHTSQKYYKQQPFGLRRIAGLLYLLMINRNLEKNKIRYILSSKNAIRDYINKGINPCYLFLFYNSFPTSYIDKLSRCRNKKKYDSKVKEIKFFTISRLDKVKQLHWAIHAVAKNALFFPKKNFKVYICGSGSDEYRLKVLSKKETLKAPNFSVEFEGFVPSILHYLKRCNFYLLPSKIEGFPLSLTESALSGIECIVTDSSPSMTELSHMFTNIKVCKQLSLAEFTDEVRKNLIRFFENGPQQNKKNFYFPSIEENTDTLIKNMIKAKLDAL